MAISQGNILDDSAQARTHEYSHEIKSKIAGFHGRILLSANNRRPN